MLDILVFHYTTALQQELAVGYKIKQIQKRAI